MFSNSMKEDIVWKLAHICNAILLMCVQSGLRRNYSPSPIIVRGGLCPAVRHIQGWKMLMMVMMMTISKDVEQM